MRHAGSGRTARRDSRRRSRPAHRLRDDLRYTDANVQTLAQLLADVDLLFIESVFLDQDSAQAARKNHLTAHQAGLIARRVGAGQSCRFTSRHATTDAPPS